MNTPTDLLQARFRLNMDRIAGLAKLTSDISPLNQKGSVFSDEVRADLFRTIVVFLHATFEDVLRTMARQRIAGATSQMLDEIPLVGISSSRSPEKFYLGALGKHRGKTVDQLIHESVEAHLDQQSFGSCRDVDVVLSQMGLTRPPR
jgi:hypothetical protein